MKKVFLVVAALIFLSAPAFTATAFARDGHDRDYHHRDKMGHRGPGGRGHMSAMVKRLIKGAESLELTASQMNSLEDIKQKHLFAIIREKAELDIAKIKVKDTAHKPDFNPKVLKEQIRAKGEIKQRIANLSVDAMAAVRATVGVENYQQLIENMPAMRRPPSGSTRGPRGERTPPNPEDRPQDRPTYK